MGSLWGLTIVIAYVSQISHASPVPEPGISNPVVHSLATYATTNSFLYSNKLGSLNYRFSKPQLARAQTFTKLVGLPFQPSLFSATGHLYTSANPSQSSFDEASQNLVSNRETKTISDDLSTFLSPPKFGTQFTPFITGILANTDAVHQKDSSNNNVLSVDNSGTAEESLKADPIPGNDSNQSINHNEPSNTNNYVDPDKITEDKIEPETPENPKSELETLFNKVINAQFHRAVPVENQNISSNTAQQAQEDVNTAEVPMQSRQDSDSNIEQPLSFFPSGTDPQQGPRLQFPSLLTGNQRFALPSNSKQANQQNQNPFSRQPQFQPQQFPQKNRFAGQQNSVAQAQPQFPTLNSPPLPHPQLMPHLSQFMPGSNNAFPAGQPGIQFPGFNNGPQQGPPPPEPENGYNPFHLSERYPEPPYESEFVNYAPDEEVDSLEQRQRSFGNDDTSPPQVLDFAQSTLRNVRTEELLDVVKRKPVPPECVYNTISYGVNGEDCIEVRKRKK